MSGIKIRAILEVLGRPENAVKLTLENIVKRVDDRKNISVLSKHFSKLKSEERGFFSAFVELDLEFEEFGEVIGFMLDFGPISLEILSPEELVLDAGSVEASLNELLTKFHTFDNQVKVLAAKILKK